MCQLMFEEFDVPALSVILCPILSLYSSGRSTGLAVDIGDGVVDSYPIYEGYAVSDAVFVNNFAGRDLTHYLAKLLNEAGYSFDSRSDLETVRDIKEKLCYVAFHPSEEFQSKANS
jgi:actin